MSDYYGDGNGDFKFDFGNKTESHNKKPPFKLIATSILCVVAIGAIALMLVHILATL